MNLDILTQIAETVGVVMMVSIITIFSLAIFWNTRYVLLVKKNHFFALRIYTIFVCAIWIAIYTYLLIQFFANPVADFSIFAGIIIRPSVLLTGGVLAANARSRYVTVKNGGCH